MEVPVNTNNTGSNLWYAFKVRTGSESRVGETLSRKGFSIFVPTYVEVRRYSDRLKKVPAPLFPGYLFSYLDVADRLPILKTPGVDTIVSMGGVPQPIEETEIARIKKVVECGAEATPWPFLREGDRVQIVFGPLIGVEGILVKVRDQARLILSVNLLQRSIAVAIDRTHVRPLA